MFHFQKRKQPRHDPHKLNAALEEMRKHIETAVACTYDPPDEIMRVAVEIAEDTYKDGVDFAPYAERILKEVVRKRLAEQSTWPEVTDCDRLDCAFAALEANGIICRPNFSCCGTCAAAEIGEEIAKEEAAGRVVRGCAHFHMQDTEHAVQGAGIYLSYGAVEPGVENSEAIGREIAAAMQGQGLTVNWDGVLAKRIGVPLDWKRRLPVRLAQLA